VGAEDSCYVPPAGPNAGQAVGAAHGASGFRTRLVVNRELFVSGINQTEFPQ